MASCEIETATIKAMAVGVPTNVARMYIVAVKRNGDECLKPKLQRWKQNMERPAPPPPTVGKYVGREGSFFLRRLHQKQLFDFNEPTVTICMEHIMARKPSEELFKAHSGDFGTLREAQELTWEDYTKLLTTNDTFVIPKTLRRRDAARVLEESTLPPICLLYTSPSPRDLSTSRMPSSA